MTDESHDRRIQVLGHPLHPILTDFPIALWSLTLVWDIAALWFGSPWWQVGFWTLLGGVVAAVGTALTGLLDARQVQPDDPAHRTVNIHMLLMGVAVTIFIGNVVVRGGPDDLSGLQATAAVLCTLIGNAVVVAGAWFGGELVFHYGVGVDERSTERSPQSGRSGPGNTR